MEIRLERVKTRTATAIFAVFSPPGPMSRSDFETFGQDVGSVGTVCEEQWEVAEG